jgi:hypothetical protein
MKRVLLLLLALPGCGLADVDDRSVRWLDYGRFVGEVQPVLQARCANPSCHGTPVRPLSLYGVRSWRADPEALFLPEALTEQELRHNYTVSCVLATEADLPEETQLLRKPLGELALTYHGGGAIFEGTTDRDYRAMLAWLEQGWVP